MGRSLSQQFIRFSQRRGPVVHGILFAYSILILAFYTCVYIVQSRFFPFQVFTLAGTLLVEFNEEFYQTLLLPFSFLSFGCTVFFIGRDSFCVSKYVLVQRQPAHQICYLWAYGLRFSAVCGLSCLIICLVGMVLVGNRVSLTLGQCVETWIPECLCSCSTPDIQQTKLNTVQQLRGGASTCLEDFIQILVPQVYFSVFTAGLVLSLLAMTAAFAEQARLGESRSVRLPPAQEADADNHEDGN